MHRPWSDKAAEPLAAGRRATPLRSLRWAAIRGGRQLSLSQRFLLAAAIVVALAMLLLGNWIGVYLQQGILSGVAGTAASSIEALISHQLGNVAPGSDITPEQRANLDSAFRIGNDAQQTRLLQVSILNIDGEVVYETSGGLVLPEGVRDPTPTVTPRVSARIIDVLVAPVGPIDPLPLTVLEIFTPLHRSDDGQVFAMAQLFFGADSVIELRDKAQRDVWVLVGLFGLLVVGVLYLLVNSASRTIERQRVRLAGNLSASRQLAAENERLRVAADELRLTANSANESLLAQVGSNIHDGPIQLLTLIILRLTRSRDAGQQGLDSTVELATEAMHDLRNISTGLVLPELGEASLRQTVTLAAERHENLTGTRVVMRLGKLGSGATLAVKIAAYRVVQEALTNAFRHGGGVGQRVLAGIEDQTLVITVENDVGAVAPTEQDRSDAQLGIKGMRFRVESLGGELDIDLGPRRARVRARIPLGAVPSGQSA